MTNCLNIGPLQIFLDQKLGSGLTGHVFKGILRKRKIVSYGASIDEQIKVAIKAIPHSHKNQNQVTSYLFECEKLALTTLDHPCILKSYYFCEDHKYSYFATQLLEQGNVQDLLKAKNKMTEKQAISMLRQLLESIDFVSRNGFTHRDIKPANIMLRKKKLQKNQFQPVLIDFGFCQHKNLIKKPSMYYNVGSPSYMAPEAFNHTLYSQKSDLWSVGTVFFEMLTGKPIDSMFPDINYFFQYPQACINAVLNHEKQALENFSVQILRKILNPNPKDRSSVSEIIQFIKLKQSQYLSNFPRYNVTNSYKRLLRPETKKEQDYLCKGYTFREIRSRMSVNPESQNSFKSYMKSQRFLKRQIFLKQQPFTEKNIIRRNKSHEITDFIPSGHNFIVNTPKKLSYQNVLNQINRKQGYVGQIRNKQITMRPRLTTINSFNNLGHAVGKQQVRKNPITLNKSYEFKLLKPKHREIKVNLSMINSARN